MPLFQFILVVTFLVLLIVVNRLYQAIRILNSRVSIQSNLIKNIRAEMKETAEEMDEEFQELMIDEIALKEAMSRDFTYQKKKTTRKPISLTRSKSPETPEATTSSPRILSRSKPNLSRSNPNLSATSRNRNEEVPLKTDMSYLHQTKKPISVEQIPSISLLQKENQPSGSNKGK